MLQDVGVVAIGRNEGERLVACLDSLSGKVSRIVYVDSGSTDGSVDFARSVGVEVVELDTDRPFTAARARNAGFERLLSIHGTLEWVQFVDGDCVVVDGWLEAARERLRSDPSLAVVCGRRRERYPDRSVWNRIIDVEWNSPVGEAAACGGDAMMRVASFRQVGGFNGELIAGEEPELCVRLRRAGFRIERLPLEMTLHDAALHHARQWWMRAVRGGHAYAEGAHLHGDSPERHWVRETRRIWMWGAVLPAVALAGAPVTLGLSLGLFLAYPLQAAKVYRGLRRRGIASPDAAVYAASIPAARFAELQGLLRFRRGLAHGRKSALIEYK